MKNMYNASKCLQTGCLLYVGIHTKKLFEIFFKSYNSTLRITFIQGRKIPLTETKNLYCLLKLYDDLPFMPVTSECN